jgi:hypothetical protein
MSHGPGRVQRAILDALNNLKEADTYTLARIAFNVQPAEDGIYYLNDAQLVATRRALTNLEKKGLVGDLRRKSGPGRLRARWTHMGHAFHQLLLHKSIQISNDDHNLGITSRLYTAAEIAKFRQERRELIAKVKALGHWPYIKARWRERP